MRPGAQDIAVSIVGYLTSDLGVGQSARLWLEVLKEVCTVEPVDLGDPWTTRRADWPSEPDRGRKTVSDVRLLCFNADETGLMLHHPVVRRAPARWTIGVWYWETDNLPRWMQRASEHVDEVWAGSSFTARAINWDSSRPVRVMPPAVPDAAGRLSPIARSTFGLPDGHLFFFEFDYRSVFDRKNPIAVVEAFCHAFSPGEGPVLFIKSVNASMFPREHQRLAEAAQGRADVVVRDVHLPHETNTRLLASCDTYVSLHRSEGFGLTLAEAAVFGKAVIATGYAGPMDFLDEGTSLLVPYRLVPVGPGRYPYGRRDVWAEPDTTVAAGYMRRVWLNPDRAGELGARARELMLRNYSVPSRASAARAALVEANLRPLDSVSSSHLSSSVSLWERWSWDQRVRAAQQVRRVRRLADGWPGLRS
jgi:Glycosyl transferases group 1